MVNEDFSMIPADLVKSIKKNKVSPEKALMTVRRHNITIREFLIFCAMAETGNIVKASQKMGVSVQKIYKMKNTKWWKELQFELLSQHQEAFHQRMSDQIHLLEESLMKLFKLELPDVKYAGALVKAWEVFGKMGKVYGDKELHPIIHSKVIDMSTINVNNNETEVNINVTFNEIEPYLSQLKPKEIDEYAQKGNLPDWLMTKIRGKEFSEEVEFIEADEIKTMESK